jgi:hypothetical protein
MFTSKFGGSVWALSSCGAVLLKYFSVSPVFWWKL